jgi:hypothetical protein
MQFGQKYNGAFSAVIEVPTRTRRDSQARLLTDLERRVVKMARFMERRPDFVHKRVDI